MKDEDLVTEKLYAECFIPPIKFNFQLSNVRLDDIFFTIFSTKQTIKVKVEIYE